MLFHVELRTDDPELIEVLGGVRNSARFVKKALRHFVSTKQGKEAFRVMSKQGARNSEKRKGKERQKHEESGLLPSDNGRKKDGYDFDRFL